MQDQRGDLDQRANNGGPAGPNRFVGCQAVTGTQEVENISLYVVAAALSAHRCAVSVCPPLLDG